MLLTFPDPHPGADLLEAAERGDTPRVAALLDGGVAVDSRDEVCESIILFRLVFMIQHR